jgi:hypothetical protein
MFTISGSPFPVRSAEPNASPVAATFTNRHGQLDRPAFFSNFSTRSSSFRVLP